MSDPQLLTARNLLSRSLGIIEFMVEENQRSTVCSKLAEEIREFLDSKPNEIPAKELSCGCEVGVCICDFEKD